MSQVGVLHVEPLGAAAKSCDVDVCWRSDHCVTAGTTRVDVARFVGAAF